MPAQPTHEVGPVGESAARAVAFGGGDERFIAWLAGYTSGLAASGVDLAQADVTVGTSAGSIVGAVVKAGVLSDFISELKQMSASNQSGSALTIPTGAESQKHARNVMAQTKDRCTDAFEDVVTREIRREMAAALGIPRAAATTHSYSPDRSYLKYCM
jgi:predicted acylesterase/phospholipase RssA